MNRIALLSLALGLAVPAAAQVTPEKITELERKIETLSEEMEKLKLGESADPVADKSERGLAPAASKVYRAAEKKVSLGGYGEMTYNNFARRRQDAGASGQKDIVDFLRAILYVGYKFNDKITFNSEIEFEHATTANTAARGEVSVEAAYIDFALHPVAGARAGLMLVPVGLTNEVHEPTTFHGVQRPSVERNVIPSTWRENGAGLFGEWGPLSYRTYLLTGLQATNNTGPTGFTGSTGIRSGRSSGAKSYAEDLAWVGRVDYAPVEGVKVGGSLYTGEADQGLINSAVSVSLWEAHAQAEYRGVELKALYTEVKIGGARDLNVAKGFTNAAQTSVGSRQFGGYGEAAFNVLSLAETKHYLAPFLRYERYDTQWKTPEGYSKNPSNSRVEYTLGLTYKPIPQVAVKADQQWMRNQGRTGVSQWNLGLAYIF